MNITIPTLTCALLAGALSAQMEKRWVVQYRDSEFARATPAVGLRVPDLRLWDLSGRPRSTLAERGRTVVLVKGSFT